MKQKLAIARALLHRPDLVFLDEPTTVTERPHVLHSAKDYNAAVSALGQLLERNPRKGTREYEVMELVALLVEDYETRNVPVPPVPAPAEVVTSMLEQKGLTKADLVEPMGGKSRVSEFFAGKRPLSTNQITALRALLGIPADLLIGDQQDSVDGMTAPWSQ